MRKAKSKSAGGFRGIIAILLVVFLVSGAMLGLSIWDRQQGRFPSKEQIPETLQHNGIEYRLKKNVETVLVLGLDQTEESVKIESYNNDQKADFLLLLVFDEGTKAFSVIHINRDTMAEINVLGIAGNKIDTVTKQITLAHTYGNGKDVSCRNTADAVSDVLLGMKVNHYLSMKMDAVAVLNDAVGGVTVEVLEDFSGIDDSLVKGKSVTLKGEQALNYVRTRYGLEDSSNNSRMKRQQQYMEALYAQAKKCAEEDNEFLIDASLKMSDYLVSDRSVTQLQAIAEKMTEYTFHGILSLEGESRLGEEYMEFYPDEEAIKNLVIDLFYTPKHNSGK